MSEKLEIKPGGLLSQTRWVYDEGKQAGSYVARDVTDIAFRFLWEYCEIAEGTTLKDIFLLIQRHQVILDLVIGNWCEEYVKEGLSQRESVKETEIEYLELYWEFLWQKADDGATEFFGNLRPSFHGVGFELKEDRLFEWGEVECPKGSRINYAVDFSPAWQLAPLPVKLRKSVSIAEEMEINSVVQTFDKVGYTLGNILEGIMWELSFMGNPTTRDAKSKEILNSAAQAIQELKSKEPQ